MVPHWDRFCHAAAVPGCQAPGIQRLLNGLKILHMFHSAWCCFLLKEPPCFLCWMWISHHEWNNNMFLQQTWPFLTDPDSKYLDDFKNFLKKPCMLCHETGSAPWNEKNTPHFCQPLQPTKYEVPRWHEAKPKNLGGLTGGLTVDLGRCKAATK